MSRFVRKAEAASLDETRRKVFALGGLIADLNTSIPGIGRLAYVNGSNANIVGIAQPDKGAA